MIYKALKQICACTVRTVCTYIGQYRKIVVFPSLKTPVPTVPTYKYIFIYNKGHRVRCGACGSANQKLGRYVGTVGTAPFYLIRTMFYAVPTRRYNRSLVGTVQ